MASRKYGFKIEGLKELKYALRELPKRTQKKVTRKAVAEGAKPIVKEAQLLVPLLKSPVPHRKRGTVRKNIGYKVRSQRNGTVVDATVWVKGIGNKKIEQFKSQTGKPGRDNPDDPFYWWFVEFGTKNMAARPFMRPAFEHKKDESLDRILNTLDQGIQEEAAKLNNRR